MSHEPRWADAVNVSKMPEVWIRRLNEREGVESQRVGYVGACGIPKRLGLTPGFGLVYVTKGVPGTASYREVPVRASSLCDFPLQPGASVKFVGSGNQVEPL